ncbi:MAG: [FeFe] hydrogenase H-cluster radical SAM maturase HydG [Candidatus Omnitrophica bacterium]|nr:[FeFe] hydrogenase H-cluster radical SAM maturase HydG [Candidatus Omnitrophota bacterium]MCF7878492.1 [FeFe] hydrogenase H-cluster radical SAM maturase HydG [Candidatus Omnitrophota bacterium]
MNTKIKKYKHFVDSRIKKEEIERYLQKGKNFIDQNLIEEKLKFGRPDPKRVKDIIKKSLDIETLSLEETAALLLVEDKNLLSLMEEAAYKIKKKVYDNRIVTFAPLYLGNYCVNDCLYCGFCKSNKNAHRKILNRDEIISDTKVLAGEIGHKRLIVVYGEHPLNDVDYIEKSIKTIYSVKEKTKNGFGQIRRVNINASPFEIKDLKRLHEVGIGTYQVFQETYHPDTYKMLHPQNTIKGNYNWRLYCMHRAYEAGIDDVGIGVLFGLYDWKFEVMGLVAHAHELENKFGVGPHTISFPRLEPADNSPYTQNSKFKVSDKDFRKLITVIRLAVPYTGMIITARETPQIREDSLKLGVTQTDASSRIGIGGYSKATQTQESNRQQFLLGDTRSLDEVIRKFSEKGFITSFCTAGYRCGRTGKCIMDLLRSGEEGKFCKLNAVLTFREWLDDFASDKTKKVGQKVINKEINEIKEKNPKIYDNFINFYGRIKEGERDLYF